MKPPERESELGKAGKVQRNELSRKKVQDVETLSRAGDDVGFELLSIIALTTYNRTVIAIKLLNTIISQMAPVAPSGVLDAVCVKKVYRRTCWHVWTFVGTEDFGYGSLTRL